MCRSVLQFVSVLHCVAECYRVLQYVVMNYSAMQFVAVFCSVPDAAGSHTWMDTELDITQEISHALYCNTLQHTATHCNTLQHTATHCNTLQHTATYRNTLQQTMQRPVNESCHTYLNGYRS